MRDSKRNKETGGNTITTVQQQDCAPQPLGQSEEVEHANLVDNANQPGRAMEVQEGGEI